MRNVYSIPSIKTLKSWLNDANFNNIRVVDVNKTTTAEQRKTP
jgi:tRNA (mo5U34)-methyltransferase